MTNQLSFINRFYNTVCIKMPKSLGFCEIKSNLSEAIANLKELGSLANVPLEQFDCKKQQLLQNRTTVLLYQLEQLPFKKILHSQQQRQHRRKRQKNVNKASKETATKLTDVIASIDPIDIATPLAATQKKCLQNIRLKKNHDAATILKTCDLLAQLCAARGGNKDAMMQQLSSVRHVWSNVMHESAQPATISKDTKNLEEQWNSVFFGNSRQQTEGGKRKLRLQHFHRRRAIWDSYVSTGLKGTSIPGGWVLPPVNSSPAWLQFKCE